MAVTYLELSKTYQDQVLEFIAQSQKLAVESMSTWAKAAAPYAKDVKTPEGVDMPAPAELVDNAFGFAEKLVAAQHAYWTALVGAAAPAMPKAKTPVAK